jgi:hypothetical protein
MKNQVFHIAVPNTMLQQRQEDLLGEFEHEGGLGAEVTELQQEIPKSINSQEVENCVIHDIEESEGENNLAVDCSPVGELADIPEASPANSASRWSKRRAGDTDEDSLERATKIKAQRNEGDNQSDLLRINISDSIIHSNLGSVGIVIGQDKSIIDESLVTLREAAENIALAKIDYKSVVCDKKMMGLESELKDIHQEEELDKVLLNQLCSDLMEEVMDREECNNELFITSGPRTSNKKEKPKSSSKRQ